ncbi:MAG: glycosyltransferase family 1 protein, partial [Eubacterium sp.]|nr:glycosyltransferase family 1 protein [Eubacterium sp.]
PGDEVSLSAGRAAGSDLPGWEARPIDIMFAGNYNPPEKQDELLKRNGPEYEKFYHDLIDDLIAHPEMEMTYAIEKHIRDGGFEDEITEESLKEVFPYMIVIDLYVRHYFRGEVVRILADAGIPIHLYGSGWEKLKTSHPEHVISHGNVDSLTCLKAARESKLSINVMPWFRHGAHDRVFNSMLNGSVCITDPSTYLQQEFTDGEDILFYSLNRYSKPNIDELPDLVTGILSDKSHWESIQLSAYKKSYAKHRWSSRADLIHQELLSKL